MMDFDKIADNAWNAAHDADLDAFEACVVLKDAAIAIKDLQALLALAQEDAARYRWLIEKSWFQDAADHYLNLPETQTCDAFKMEANKSIDAAMRS